MQHFKWTHCCHLHSFHNPEDQKLNTHHYKKVNISTSPMYFQNYNIKKFYPVGYLPEKLRTEIITIFLDLRFSWLPVVTAVCCSSRSYNHNCIHILTKAQNIQCCHHKSLPLSSIRSQFNLCHILITCFFKIHLNILLSTSNPKWSIPVKFFNHNIVCISPMHAISPVHRIFFDLIAQDW